jgi:hypothetical protein
VKQSNCWRAPLLDRHTQVDSGIRSSQPRFLTSFPATAPTKRRIHGGEDIHGGETKPHTLFLFLSPTQTSHFRRREKHFAILDICD